MLRRYFLILLSGAILLGCADGDDPKLYQDAPAITPATQQVGLGPFIDARMSFELTDTERDREFAVDVWFPSSEWFFGTEMDNSGAPYPLVVYTHGYMGSSDDGEYICERLSTYGIIAIAATRPDTIMASYPDLTTDISFIIDYMLQQNEDPQSTFYGTIDPEHIGSIGHSLGGYAAFANASVEDRVKALVGLAPALQLPATSAAEINIPTMTMWATHDYMISMEQSRPYYDNANPPKYGIEIEGGNHSGFISDPVSLEPGEIEPEEQNRLTLLYSASFFLYYLKGNEDYADILTEENAIQNEPGITFLFE
jgi:pimeloyl-ACP methyl ester carboxylesterase